MRFGASSRGIADRLGALLRTGDRIDVAFVHRDAEAQTSASRRAEIEAAAARVVGFTSRVVPVVPVRMTEAAETIANPKEI